MDMNHFVNEMNRLNAIFKGINEKGRIERYFAKVKDIPNEALTEIADHYLDNFRQMPLPNDFERSANEWRRLFYDKNGYYYNSISKGAKVHDTSIGIDCRTCYDTGYAWVQCDDNAPFVYCSCKQGIMLYNNGNGIFKLPQLTHELKSLFKIKEFPFSFFKLRTIDDILKISANEVTSNFSSELKASAKYWGIDSK